MTYKHATPCTCTINNRTGQIVNYDCGDTLMFQQDAGHLVDMVNHPPHYSAHPSGIECIRMTRDMTFNAGNAVKYVYRADYKNGDEDLRKARWYLIDAISTGDSIMFAKDVAALRKLLHAVAGSEPRPRKAQFFREIANRDLQRALAAVNDMIDGSDGI